MSRVVIKSEDRRFVLGEVYFPDAPDSQGDYMDAVAIEKAAHAFVANGYSKKIDVEHSQQESGNVICESFIVRSENNPDGFRKGAWVLGAYVYNDSDWQAVKKGDLNGWSMSGMATSRPVLCAVDVPIRLIGKTESCSGDQIPDHDHEIDITFGEDGKVIVSETSPPNAGPSHTHEIRKTTATGESMDHSHRIVTEE